MAQELLNLHQRPHYDYQLSTMSSPNSCAASASRVSSRDQNRSSSLLHQPRTIYIGKEQYPINLTLLEHVSVATWKKQRGFDQLEMAVLSLRSTHHVADLMEVIRQQNSGRCGFSCAGYSKSDAECIGQCIQCREPKRIGFTNLYGQTGTFGFGEAGRQTRSRDIFPVFL